MKDLFKVAVKKKYRFNYKGALTVEDLYDLSVEDLDAIYKKLKLEQGNTATDSLLGNVTSADKALQNKIDLVTEIFNDKMAEKDKAKKAFETKQRNQRILEIMASKQAKELEEKSIDELKEMLETEDTDEDE